MKSRFDIEQLLIDHGIDFRPGNKNWIQLACPFCYRNDGKFGLGWSGTVFNCFKCGRLDFIETLSEILDQIPAKTAHIASQYKTHIKSRPEDSNRFYGDLSGVLMVKMPYKAIKPGKIHLDYLKSRDFGLEIVKTWHLLGTGTISDLPYRIVAPIIQDGKTVCWQARDITDRAPNKYKTCPDDKAVIPAKQCLYGIDLAKGKSVVITEGVTKVWRLGPGAIATFGASVTEMQMMKIQERWSKVFILFDEDEAGFEGADKLGRALAPLGVQVQIIQIGIRDVADLKQDEANKLMKELK